MIQDQLSQEADTASARYALLVAAFRGDYATAFHGGDLAAPSQVGELREAAYTSARIYLAGESDQAERATSQIALGAHQSALADLGLPVTGDSDLLTGALLGSLAEHLDNETRVQIERDVALMAQTMRRAQLSIHTAARAQGIGLKPAMIQFRMTNGSELNFTFQDRQNRKWPSQKFIRSAWRGHLLGVHNDIYLATAAEHGATTFEVSHPDASEHAGKRFSTLHTAALPHYDEIRDQVFHPNSNAVAKIAA